METIINKFIDKTRKTIHNTNTYMTKLQIIEETAAFYGEDTTRRATYKNEYGNTQCSYLMEDGRKCAFGRVLENPEILKDQTCSVWGIYKKVCGSFDIKFLPQYNKYSQDMDFWDSIQSFHDNDIYWDKKGLTKLGKSELKHLKERYSHE